MGLMRALGNVATGYLEARVDQFSDRAKQKAEAKALKDKYAAEQVMRIAVQNNQLDKAAELKELSDVKLADEAYRVALGELGDAGLVEQLKLAGKLKDLQTYQAWKTPWQNYTGEVQFWNIGNFIKDFKTASGTQNTSENAEKNLVDINGLSTNVAKSQTDKATGKFDSGTQKSTTDTEEPYWATQYKKATKAPAAPTSEFLKDTTTDKMTWVTNQMKIDEPNRYVKVTDPKDAEIDLTPFGDNSIYAGIWTSDAEPGKYFQNLQLDVTDTKGMTEFLKQNKGYTINSQGYVLDTSGNNVPVEVSPQDIKNIEAIEQIDNYQILNPANTDHLKILEEQLGYDKQFLKKLVEREEVIQHNLDFLNGIPVFSGEAKIISVAIANQKFDTSRLTIEKGINAELTNYFDESVISHSAITGATTFKTTTGSLDDGRKNFFLSKTNDMLQKSIEAGSAPSAKMIVANVNHLAEGHRYGVYQHAFKFDNAKVDAQTFMASTPTLSGLKLIQAYLTHYGKSTNYKPEKEFFLNMPEGKSDAQVSKYLKEVSQELYKLIVLAEIQAYKK